MDGTTVFGYCDRNVSKMTVLEVGITLIDHETGESRPVIAQINLQTRETIHVPRHVAQVMAELREEEEEPDG